MKRRDHGLDLGMTVRARDSTSKGLFEEYWNG